MRLFHPDAVGGERPVVLQVEEAERLPVARRPTRTRGPAAQLGRPPGAPPAGAPPTPAAPAAAPAPRRDELPPEEAAPKIRAFDQRLAGGNKHEDSWTRSPNVTGT